ncbi:MAG: hypothetical protein R3C12_12225 [Planctomycetaceae bacterium]
MAQHAGFHQTGMFRQIDHHAAEGSLKQDQFHFFIEVVLLLVFSQIRKSRLTLQVLEQEMRNHTAIDLMRFGAGVAAVSV